MATNSSKQTTPESNLQTGGSEDFMTLLQNKLLGQSDIISSTNNDLETNISNAITSLKEGNTASDKYISSQYDRSISNAKENQGQQIRGSLENRSGYATNMTALRALTKTTDDNIKDLESRKAEALLANDAETYSKIADLQLKEIEFRQNAEQQTFSNLLGMANYGLSVEDQKLKREQMSFTERSAIADIATKFGITATADDTIESITAKAAATGLVSDQQKAELAQTLAQTRLINAQIGEINNNITNVVDDKNLEAFAQAAITNPAVLGTIKNSSDVVRVINKMTEIQKKGTLKSVQDELNNGTYSSKESAIKAAQNAVTNGTLDATMLPDVIDYINNNWKESTVKKENSVYGAQDLGADIFGSFVNTVGGLAGFLTGEKTPNVYSYEKKAIVKRK